MIIKKIFNYLLITTLFIVILPLISSGQSTPAGNSLAVSMVPINPEPGQNVKITLSSFSYDLDRSKITWIINGVTKKTEIGLKEFNTSAGNNGQKTTVKVSVETPTAGIQEVEAFFIPSLVDLIYEASSYTPPFYKGKSLNPSQGMVRIIAMPELIRPTGEKIPAQNVIYQWKKDGEAYQSASGLGKNTFTFSGTIPIRDVEIEVIASSLAGDIYASKKLTIVNNSPKIIFYEDNPLYGIMFNRAIGNVVHMTEDEFKVKAFPYYMGVGYTGSPDLNYNWTINNALSENLDTDKTAMIFRQESSGAGTASISLKIENLVKIFQFATNSFTLNFEKQ